MKRFSCKNIFVCSGKKKEKDRRRILWKGIRLLRIKDIFASP